MKGYGDRTSVKDDLVIVGDTEVDVSAGKELGITTVTVKCGIRSKEFLEALEPHLLISDLPELIELFRCPQKYDTIHRFDQRIRRNQR